MANTNIKYESRVCPSCGCSDTGNVSVSSKHPAEYFDLDDLQSHWNGFFKEKVIFSYSRCAKCHLLYSPTFFSDGQLEALYAQMPDNTAGVPLEALEKTQKGYFNILKEYKFEKGGYLETGPDIGLFTKNIISNPALKKFWLFEPNRTVWPTLSKLADSDRLHLSAEMFGFSEVPDQSISVAVMIHVLDHLINPVEILKKLRMKMAPGAVLAVVTHDESSLLAKITGNGWPAYCLQHPQLYSPKTIRALMKEAGFNVVQVQRTVNYFPVTYLFKHLLWAFGIRINVPSWDALQIPLKLGNILTIASPE
ncbi:class I SAM-dependent methyltransferase [Methylomonas rosea]|uniref:Class I SAM-dependent methyltransferase n=1 Tax=Methylomonas rosea TaxID=2952227 RepID=A0ABT1TTS5_9GAMM|nr:class I SAM-dependent methyltransferase [Methylomonas sp. WSC-7]MCQ8118182.1 class I SAM-dependent methyltransferase [Methylomonas sp. WSC-7]